MKTAGQLWMSINMFAAGSENEAKHCQHEYLEEFFWRHMDESLWSGGFFRGAL
jgi:hypothetical protein